MTHHTPLKATNLSRLFNLLSVGADAKTVKGQKSGYMTGILYLAPSNQSGVMNTCPHASEGCRAACLYTAGMGKFDNVKAARIRKTVLFKTNREEFMRQLDSDIILMAAVARAKGMTPAIRLNGTSDLPFEEIAARHPSIAFYDYTKDFAKMIRFLDGKMPENYHLTFSRSESNAVKVNKVIAKGGNVAVVFGKTLPASWQGREVISGDENDLRFLDKRGVIVGLTSKGKAKKDESGFVVRSC